MYVCVCVGAVSVFFPNYLLRHHTRSLKYTQTATPLKMNLRTCIQMQLTYTSRSYSLLFLSGGGGGLLSFPRTEKLYRFFDRLANVASF